MEASVVCLYNDQHTETIMGLKVLNAQKWQTLTVQTAASEEQVSKHF